VTRVGKGPLENELDPDELSKRGWSEFGTVTGRPRRASEFNFELAKRAIMLNSATQIAITKLDVRFPDSEGKTSYDDLSGEAKSFIKKIEDELGVPVTIIGTGPAINQIIDRRK
jgi:adenylosuccinate synthase